MQASNHISVAVSLKENYNVIKDSTWQTELIEENNCDTILCNRTEVDEDAAGTQKKHIERMASNKLAQ